MDKFVDKLQELNEYLYSEGHVRGLVRIKLGETAYDSLVDYFRGKYYHNWIFYKITVKSYISLMTSIGEIEIHKDLSNQIKRLEEQKSDIEAEIKALKEQNG